MNTVQVRTSVTISGTGIGTPTDSVLTHVGDVRRTTNATAAGSGSTLCDQFIDQASSTTTLGAGTTTIDLSNFTNALSQTGQAMTKVRVLFFEHDSASAASSIVLFNAAANSFQGPVSAGASVTLLPGERFEMESPTTAGWAVDGTHKNLAIVVAGGTATLRYFVAGSTT